MDGNRELQLLREFDGLAAAGRLDAAAALGEEAIGEGSRRLALRLRLSATLIKLGRYAQAADRCSRRRSSSPPSRPNCGTRSPR